MFFRCFQSDLARAGSRIFRLLPLLSLVLILGGLALVSGCGGGSGSDKDDVVLAMVGDHEITGGYYESKLIKLEEKELPRGDDGMILDMAQMEGKKEFLTSLINKELMAQKAIQLGYGNDPQVVGLRETMTMYEAKIALWEKEISEPSNTISPEELEIFYARMGEVRDCSFLITNFKEDAEAAREMARGGADWEEVTAKYHDGQFPPENNFGITIPFGRYNMDFDTDVFYTEVGDVTPPILTNYGFWVLKVNEVRENPKPDLEEAKSKILDVVRNRNLATLRKEYKEQVRKSYGFFINEDVLWIAYMGMPEGEVLLDPVTQKPVPREELKPLNVNPKDMDKVFYGHLVDGEMVQFTLGDYKTNFDRMSVFQRPKESEMLGGMRQKITDSMDKSMMELETKALGYLEDPDVVAKVGAKVEEMMVTKLYQEVIAFDERILPAAEKEFWAAHSAEYYVPETFNGYLVICRNEETAQEARKDIEAGMKWSDALVQYGIDKGNKSNSGKLTGISRKATGPVPEAMFLLAEGELSQPIALDNNRFALIRLLRSEPGFQPEFEDRETVVRSRISSERQEEAFHSLLTKWADSFGVTRFDDQLVSVSSWEELTTVEAPGEAIPR